MDLAVTRAYFLGLQKRIVAAPEAIDGVAFRRDEWTRSEGGGGVTCAIENGVVLERGGVLFSHVTGNALPPSATAQRPELAGRAWEAMGVSLVLHPRNPHAPTVHMNVRFFIAHPHSQSDSAAAPESRREAGQTARYANIGRRAAADEGDSAASGQGQPIWWF